MVHFLLDHWRGKLSLKVSLWINLIGLLALLALIEPIILAQFSHNPDRLLQATLISLLISRLIIYPWQLIGLLRTSDQHFLQHRNGFAIRGVYIAVILSLAYTFIYINPATIYVAFSRSQPVHGKASVRRCSHSPASADLGAA